MSGGFVKIIEVGPRDGLQNETVIIPTNVKVEFINALSESGLKEIEVSSFVSPKWIPQLGDAEEVFKQINRKKGVIYSALVPNEKGLERALALKLEKIAVFTAASESFNKKNINATIDESIERFKPVVGTAKKEKIFVRAYISTAFWCPYEGKIQPKQVLPVLESLLSLGVDEISIGDTIGKASPVDVRNFLKPALKIVKADRIALHFHDTYGMAIANALTALEDFGIRTYDSSAGGLGGCPYAKGATGNVATEDLVYAFESSGFNPNVSIQQVVLAAKRLGSKLKSKLSFI